MPDTHAPGHAGLMAAADEHVATGAQVETGDAAGLEDGARADDSPTFHDSGGVGRAIIAVPTDVEGSVTQDLHGLGGLKDLGKVIGDICRGDLTPHQAADLALGLERAETAVHLVEPIEGGVGGR